jgi:membrane protein required for colicin V production
MTVTVYDAIMLLIIVVCVIQGAWRGMVWQIAPIASLVLGYIVAYPMSERTAQYFGQPPTNRLFAMIVIYLAVSLAVYLMVRSVRESLERVKLVEFDRHLGALLGGVKGVLFTIAVTIGLLSVSQQARPLILQSKTHTVAARIVGAISPILPPNLNEVIRPYVQQLQSGEENDFGLESYGGKLPVLDPLLPTARHDNLSKPKRFDDNDGFVPQAHDDVPFGLPDERPKQPAPKWSTPPRTSGNVPTEPDDFFNADPDRAASSSTRSTR